MNINQLSAETTKAVEISKVIDYRIKCVYGRENIYVASEHRTWITKLTKKATIDPWDIEALEGLGFTFNRVF